MNFDKIIDRKGTDCLKFDAAKRRHRPEDVLPLWIADMDFEVSPAITKALTERVKHGIFGYSESDPDRLFKVLQNWFHTEHNWDIQKEWLLQTPGVVFALAMAVRAYTKPGDAVLLQQPVYYPFKMVIEDNGRKVVNTPLLKNNDHYEMDFTSLEESIVQNKIKLLLFCNPHNPVGRVWTEAELKQLGDICLKHDVIVVSDEIHQDFTWGNHKHFVYANLGKSYAQNCVICTAPSKTFNIAGLQASNIFIPNKELRKQFKKEIDRAGYSQLNTLGLVALEAAYKEGKPWLTEVKEYIWQNYVFTQNYLKENLPEIKLSPLEGTYLIWLDFRSLNLTESEREYLLLQKAKLWLDSGAIFGNDGDGFERINIACPRATLTEALERLTKAIKEI